MQKRRDLCQYIRTKNKITCLQDNHIDYTTFSHAEWGFNLDLSAKPDINASRG